MKPVGRSQGKGIFLFTKLSQITQWKSDSRWRAPDNPGVESYVVQRYVANPYLIGGKKFDMRLYALVTSFQPLTVYVYRAGFCRFSASRYSSDAADVANRFMHLTNVAVQKDSDLYNADTGGKWELCRLKPFLTARHGAEACDRCFAGMQDIILLTLQAVAKSMMADRHCFELYGYDVLIDDQLKPWLIEVNASPSLTANTREDYDLKFKLLMDTLDIVDMEGRFAPQEPQSAAGAAASAAAAAVAAQAQQGALAGQGSGAAGAAAGGAAGAGAAGTGAADGASSLSTAATAAAAAAAPQLVLPNRVGGFDLVWRDGPVPVPVSEGLQVPGAAPGASVYSSLLGADFDKRLNVWPSAGSVDQGSSSATDRSTRRTSSSVGAHADHSLPMPCSWGAGGAGRSR
jgi:hypothetical protein